jgi:uncharacterized protein YndB with AHSA1/START domain
MSITSVDLDYDNLTITLIADFDAPIERVWDLWSDPRKLERWWGPPTHPATVEKHDLTPGGEVTYVMTGPEGATRGAWRVTAVNPPTSLEFTGHLRRPGRDADRGHAGLHGQSPAHRARRRHTDGDAFDVRIPRRHGEADEHGHSRGPATGRRPNRRHPRVARRSHLTARPRARSRSGLGGSPRRRSALGIPQLGWHLALELLGVLLP